MSNKHKIRNTNGIIHTRKSKYTERDRLYTPKMSNTNILMNILGLSIAASAFWLGQLSIWFGLLLPIGFGIANVSNCIESGKGLSKFTSHKFEDN